jgi:hypothetical protein
MSKELEQPMVLWQDGWRGSFITKGDIPYSYIGNYIKQMHDDGYKVVGVRIGTDWICQVLIAKSGGNYHE